MDMLVAMLVMASGSTASRWSRELEFQLVNSHLDADPEGIGWCLQCRD